MLGIKKKDNTTYSKTSTTVIAQGTRIKGNLSFQGNLDVSGIITGNISATDDKSQLRVLPGGSIKGEVNVPFILINGTVEGDIHASKHLEFSGNAKVNGNIHYSLIEIAKGAQVFGNFYQNDKTPSIDEALPSKTARVAKGSPKSPDTIPSSNADAPLSTAKAATS